MASRRNRPTLYEVVHRSRREPLRRPTPIVKPEPSVEPQSTHAPPPEPAPAAVTTTVPAPSVNPTVGLAAPAVKLQNGNLYLRLGLPGLALGGLAAVALLAAAYQAGRNAGLLAVGVDPRDDLGALLHPPPAETPAPAPDVRGPSLPPPVATPGGGRPLPDQPLAAKPAPQVQQQPAEEKPASPPPAEASRFELVPGRTYVKIQHFPVSREDDARAAQAYFAENGVVTELMIDRREIRLFSREGFDDRRGAQKLRDTILRLGKAYKGGYDFQGAEIYVKAAG